MPRIRPSKPSLPVIKPLKPVKPVRSIAAAKTALSMPKRAVRPPLMPKR
jgi:hypothetical protein